MILETAMSANGALSFGISVYENVAKLRGILTGNTVTHRLERIERSLGSVQRIEEHLARSSLREVAPVEGTARPVEDLAALTAPARRVQAAIGADLIQSAAIEAPEPLLRVFAQNPEDLLHAIRPLASDADLPQDLMADPTMVPVVFERWGAQFVGWTRRGTLSLTLGTDYTSRVAPDILGQARTASPPPEAEAGLSAKELFDRGFEADGQQDYAEAMRWYRRAAEKGHAKAMNNIGVLYERGEGVPADPAAAAGWFARALAAGNDHTKERFSQPRALYSAALWREMQTIFARAGVYSGRIDGEPGPATYRAVEAFFGRDTR